MTQLTRALAATGVAAMFLLAGCGPESTTATTRSSSSAQTSSDDSKPRPGPGGNSEQMEEVQACLEKAGLDDKLPQRPDGASGDERKGGGPFADKDVRKALKACGIELPERPTGGNPPS